MAMPIPTIAKPLHSLYHIFQGNYNQLIQFLRYVEDSIGHGFRMLALERLTGADIALRSLVEECHDNLKGFNQWLWDKQAELANDRNNFYL